MSAIRLEVETHIVTAAATAVQNLQKCVMAADVKIDELVASSLASAEAVLTETEKDLGVGVADIGAGTIDIALFSDGSPFHTSVLPVGGNNVTMDIAVGPQDQPPGRRGAQGPPRHLRPALGRCRRDDQRQRPRRGSRPDRQPDGALPDHRGPLPRDARARRATRCARPATGCCPAGIVLTGGAAQLAGLSELGREVLEMPVRVAGPTGVGGLVDNLLTPAYSTAIGLLRWGAAVTMSGEPVRYDSAPAGGIVGRIRDALRNLFP